MKWNEVTWYSKLLAAIFLFIVWPVLTFNIGVEYQKTVDTLDKADDLLKAPVIIPNSKTNEGNEENMLVESGIKGMVTIGPTCPVERVPQEEKCKDKPYIANLRLIDSKGNIVKTFTSNADGSFKLVIPEGIYRIENTSSALYPSFGVSDPIEVKTDFFTEVQIKFDSGIR